MTEAFRILVVCTGNLCRSPLTERLLRTRLDAGLGPYAEFFQISSAGIRGLDAYEMDHRAAEELRRLGGDPSGFRSRSLTETQVTAADLVLTAGREHRSGVLREAPGALRRTFTLTEFANLAPYRFTTADTWRAALTEAVRDAADRRGSATLENYDLDDPIGGSAELHRRVADDIGEAVDRIVGGLVEVRDRVSVSR